MPDEEHENQTDVDRRMIAACPICQSRRLHYAFSRNFRRMVRCAECGLMLVNPQPTDEELEAIYGAGYFLGDGDEGGADRVAAMKAATARRYLADIARYRGESGGTLLEIGCGRGELIAEAEKLGYQVTGVEISPAAADGARRRIRGGAIVCGQVDSAGLTPASFDVCVLSDVLEHVRDPVALLKSVHRMLKPGATLFVATPSLDSWSARLLRQNWMEFKPEHLTYFDANTIQSALFQSGFAGAIVRPGWKVLNLAYVSEHFGRFQVPMVGGAVRLAARLAPRRIRHADFTVVASGMIVLARQAALPARRKLSIIVPAYNEAATLESLLQGLLRKRIADLDIEIILVESNSSDGTRDIALQYANHPRLRLILQDHARGKGYAVRAGLAAATGDFILIQDADLEYDLEDYDALLEPLLQGREALVLGSRHGGRVWWKMRRFADQRLLSLLTNCGHWLFTAMLNFMFRQRLRDPFTMFKVFRRDCLTGLEFRCNRFDFDIELLARLLGKGYKPVEIPVNYRSRSYRQGKKVNPVRDPWTWLWALVRLRLTRSDLLAAVERRRLTDPAPIAAPARTRAA